MQTIRLLTIRNGVADNALMYLDELARITSDVCFSIGRANLGGCSLEKHWNLAQHTDRYPDYKTYYRVGWRPTDPAHKASLQESLTAAPWDYVTLQQYSGTSWRRDSFQPYLEQLHAIVSRLARLPDITAFSAETEFPWLSAWRSLNRIATAHKCSASSGVGEGIGARNRLAIDLLRKGIRVSGSSKGGAHEALIDGNQTPANGPSTLRRSL